MPTLAFTTCEIHPTTRGGAGVFVHHATRRLLDDGHRVVLLLDLARRDFERFRDRDRPELAGHERCVPYHVDELCQDLPIAPADAPTPAIFHSIRWAHALRKLLTLEKPDLIEFYDFSGPAYAALVARAFGVLPPSPPIAVRLHTTLELIDEFGGTRYLNLDRYSMYALERGSLRLADAVLTPSRSFFNEVCRGRYDIADERVVVAVPPKAPEADAASHRVSANPANPSPAIPTGGRGSIIFLGRMFQVKGVDQFVRAGVELLRRRPSLDVRFDALGSDSSDSPLGESYVEYLRSLIPASMRDRFAFPGHLARDEVDRRLAAALFAVFPSTLESFGYALHEAYDAGVPIIVNDIPAVRDFFQHERHALLYDGRTDSLVAAMERLIDNPTLRDRLCRPVPITTDGWDEFYRAPRPPAPTPTNIDARGPDPRTLVVIVGSAGQDSAHQALRAQSVPPTRIVCLHEASANGDGSLWYLGRSWHPRDDAGRAVAPEEIRTLDTLAVLRAGDRPDADWLALCRRALVAQPQAAFAGTWGMRGARIVPNAVDLLPETWPFDRGAALTRVLVRTEPNRPLADVLDPAFGSLADIALVWAAVGRWGEGLILPEPHIDLAPEPPDPPDANLLKYLLARRGAPFEPGLRVYAGLLFEREQATRAGATASAPDPSLDHKLSVANQLGGRTLFRLAWAKAWRRLRGKAPPT